MNDGFLRQCLRHLRPPPYDRPPPATLPFPPHSSTTLIVAVVVSVGGAAIVAAFIVVCVRRAAAAAEDAGEGEEGDGGSDTLSRPTSAELDGQEGVMVAGGGMQPVFVDGRTVVLLSPGPMGGLQATPVIAFHASGVVQDYYDPSGSGAVSSPHRSGSVPQGGFYMTHGVGPSGADPQGFFYAHTPGVSGAGHPTGGYFLPAEGAGSPHRQSLSYGGSHGGAGHHQGHFHRGSTASDTGYSSDDLGDNRGERGGPVASHRRSIIHGGQASGAAAGMPGFYMDLDLPGGAAAVNPHRHSLAHGGGAGASEGEGYYSYVEEPGPMMPMASPRRPHRGSSTAGGGGPASSLGQQYPIAEGSGRDEGGFYSQSGTAHRGGGRGGPGGGRRGPNARSSFTQQGQKSRGGGGPL